MLDDAHECLPSFGRERLREREVKADGRDARGALCAHVERATDLETIGRDVVAAQVATGVEGNARGKARDEELGWRGSNIGAAVLHGLVDVDLMAADIDDVVIAFFVSHAET